MKRISPQHRDLISVVVLVLILVAAFPLLGSWFGDRVKPVQSPTPIPTTPIIATPTPEATIGLRALLNNALGAFRLDIPKVGPKLPAPQSKVIDCPKSRAPQSTVLFLWDEREAGRSIANTSGAPSAAATT